MDNQAVASLNLCLDKAGLTAGTTTTYTTAAAVAYAIKGKLYSKAAVTNGATPTTDFATGAAFKPVPIGFTSVFLLGFDAGGTVRVCQGTIEATGGNAPQFPTCPNTMTAVGYIVVNVGTTGAAWTFGTSNLAGPPTGVTFSFQDILCVPDRPQVS